MTESAMEKAQEAIEIYMKVPVSWNNDTKVFNSSFIVDASVIQKVFRVQGKFEKILMR